MVPAVLSSATSDDAQHVVHELVLPMARLCHRRFLLTGHARTRLTSGTGTSTMALPRVGAPSSSLSSSSRSESAQCAGWKNTGPVSNWCAAAAGPSPPRPPLPDLQLPSPPAAFAAAAGAAGFFAGPPFGQFGLPCSAFSLAYILVVSISGVARSKCGPFQQATPWL